MGFSKYSSCGLIGITLHELSMQSIQSDRLLAQGPSQTVTNTEV